MSTPVVSAPPAARAGAGATVLLGIAFVVTLVFLVSFFGTNAEGLGAHDMGIALALAFAMPMAFYASLVIAALALVLALLARWRRRPAGRWLAALGVAVVPAVCLLLADLL